MAYDTKLAARAREYLILFPKLIIEEKKIFGRLAFMVNGKMCVTVGEDRIMCRIDPQLHEASIKKNGITTVIMRGREYKGYVYVNGKNIKTKNSFEYWVNLALDYNQKLIAKAKK